MNAAPTIPAARAAALADMLAWGRQKWRAHLTAYGAARVAGDRAAIFAALDGAALMAGWIAATKRMARTDNTGRTV